MTENGAGAGTRVGQDDGWLSERWAMTNGGEEGPAVQAVLILGEAGRAGGKGAWGRTCRDAGTRPTARRESRVAARWLGSPRE